MGAPGGRLAWLTARFPARPPARAPLAPRSLQKPRAKASAPSPRVCLKAPGGNVAICLFYFSPRGSRLRLSMEDPSPLDTPEVVGGLKTRLFEGPKSIGSLWAIGCEGAASNGGLDWFGGSGMVSLFIFRGVLAITTSRSLKREPKTGARKPEGCVRSATEERLRKGWFATGLVFGA